MAKDKKKKKSRYRFQVPAPPGISTTRYVVGRLFASVEYWPRLVLAIAVLLAVVLARQADLPKMVEFITKTLEASAIVGWIVAACMLLFSIITILFIIWWYGRELDRVAKERDELQQKLMEQEVQRSSQL